MRRFIATQFITPVCVYASAFRGASRGSAIHVRLGLLNLIGASVFCLMAGSALTAGAQPDCDSTVGDNQVKLFADVNYQGPCVTLDIGNYSRPTFGIANDSISSLKVGANVQVVLCQDDDFGGECELFKRNDLRLIGNAVGNDSVSSLKVQLDGTIECMPGANQVALFKHPDYVAPCELRSFDDGGEHPKLGDAVIPNDSVSSVKLGSESRVVLCEHENFNGRCRLFQVDAPRLSGMLVVLNDNTASSAWVLRTSSYRLPQTIFVGRANQTENLRGDLDKDGLRDDFEAILAEQFKPVLRFDKGEGARRPIEPIVLFQVRPLGCAGTRCANHKVVIRWMFLFVWDGGYPKDEAGACSSGRWFNERHEGDNDRAAFVLNSPDSGRSWELERVHVGGINNPNTLSSRFTWPPNNYRSLSPRAPVRNEGQLGRLDLQGVRRPFIHMSNGKHHMYPRAGDWGRSAYTTGFCADDVDSDGDWIDPDLRSVGLPNDRLNNVGEPEVAKLASLTDYFVGSLIHLFPTSRCDKGRHAWSENKFCSDETFANAKAWQSSAFDLRP